LLQIGAISRTTANKIAESIYTNDLKKLQQAITEYMDTTISFYDSGSESFYHGMMLGLVALMDNQYKIKSNRESGDGRYDISLIPRNRKHFGVIMELKSETGLSEKELETLSVQALNQIHEKRYDVEMRGDGVENIIELGIAFSGKKVRIKTKE
jgi:hypothetical protein